MDGYQFFSKASFNHNQTATILFGKSAILLVSVGQKYHEGDKLAATVELINASQFKFCTIAVADTLQRHNDLMTTPERARTATYTAGSDWLKRNAEILNGLTVPFTVYRWDEALSDPLTAGLHDVISDAYGTNPTYRDAINATISTFVERIIKRDRQADTALAFKSCLNYLLEECPIIMPLWAAQGCDFIIYPQPMTSAMHATHLYFVADQYPEKSQWLSLKFKKRALPHLLPNHLLTS
ncbi:hypothetical protein [Serratia fonticola]|uniref:hypothetical protein n=1 Tax=Serratia fonticola TaxID=47917 RepID=UPI0034C616F0